MFSGNDSLFFSKEYYQILIATHLPTPKGWKAELAWAPWVFIPAGTYLVDIFNWTIMSVLWIRNCRQICCCYCWCCGCTHQMAALFCTSCCCCCCCVSIIHIGRFKASRASFRSQRGPRISLLTRCCSANISTFSMTPSRTLRSLKLVLVNEMYVHWLLVAYYSTSEEQLIWVWGTSY